MCPVASGSFSNTEKMTLLPQQNVYTASANQNWCSDNFNINYCHHTNTIVALKSDIVTTTTLVC